jgi:hypothetical protein
MAQLGRKFTRDQKALGRVMLGVSDAHYQQWILRLDLHSIAMFGRGDAVDGAETRDAQQADVVQPDNVVVKRKKKNTSEGMA